MIYLIAADSGFAKTSSTYSLADGPTDFGGSMPSLARRFAYSYEIRVSSYYAHCSAHSALVSAKSSSVGGFAATERIIIWNKFSPF